MLTQNSILHVVLPADVFPPGKVGGAAWSSLQLATVLRERGHRVSVVVPKRGAKGIARREVQGLPVIEVSYAAPSVPFVQNYFRYERLWPRLRDVLVEVVESAPDLRSRTVIHAQHSQTGPAAVLAGCKLGVPSVVTVRDHWPWDYFATGLHGDLVPYPRNSWASLMTDLVARLGPWRGSLALPAVPYMLQHVRKRARLLAEADAVVAVSHYVARRLMAVAAPQRVHVVPNIVDLPAIAQVTEQQSMVAPREPFVLYVGKLERNKGAHLLPAILRSQPSAPFLLIAGDGSLRPMLEAELNAAGVRFHILPGWTEHDEVLRLMARAEVLLFPSAWGDPLSRVLLEASAAGACILALDTGGTGDAIVDERSGVLVTSIPAMQHELTNLLQERARRAHLKAGAQRWAQSHFSPSVVGAQIEGLYERLLIRQA